MTSSSNLDMDVVGRLTLYLLTRAVGGKPLVATVIDTQEDPVLTLALHTTLHPGVDLALRRARAALRTRRSTAYLARGGGGAEIEPGYRRVGAGGMPITFAERMLGAIGVAGSEDDEEIAAQASLAPFGE